MAFDLQHVKEIAQRVAESSGLELVDVELQGGGKGRTLRIVIDRPAMVSGAIGAANSIDSAALIGEANGQPRIGVTHEDCANVSREVSTIIDVEDAVPGGEYTLEVSSPGLDRKLSKAADFARFTGSLVKLMTREPVNKNRHFQGRLENFSDGRLTLDTSSVSKKKQKKMGNPEGAKVEIELANVERANLVPEI